MQYFDFSYLINKYKSECKAITFLAGYYDEKGDWVKGDNEVITLEGAIINFKYSSVVRSEGKLTTKDKRLFTLTPISNALHGSKVVYENNVYSIEDESENAKFTGVYAYTLKYISAFKDARIDSDITDLVEDLEERLDGVLVKDTPTVPDETDYIEKLDKRLDGESSD